MYCTNCGSLLSTKFIRNEGDIPYCQSCDKLYFPKMNLAMITILVNSKEQICLAQQNKLSKHKGLLAGFIKVGETLEDCVKREVKEEVGIDVDKCEYLNSYFYEKNEVLMYGFISHTEMNDFVIDKDEIESAEWYDKSDCLHRIREGSIAHRLVKEYLERN